MPWALKKIMTMRMKKRKKHQKRNLVKVAEAAANKSAVALNFKP